MIEATTVHPSVRGRKRQGQDADRNGIWERGSKRSPSLIHIGGGIAKLRLENPRREFCNGVNANKRPHRVISSLRFRVARYIFR